MAQIVAARVAMGRQLYAMGFLPDTQLDDDTPALDLLIHMYHGMLLFSCLSCLSRMTLALPQDHGDTIALQYGGSQLVSVVGFPSCHSI